MDVLEKSFNNLAQIGMVKVYENCVPVYKTDETDFRIKTDRLSEFVNENQIGYPFLQGNAEFCEIHPNEEFWTPEPKKLSKIKSFFSLKHSLIL